MAHYPNFSKEKNFLYKAVGGALAVSQNISYIEEQLQSYLERVRRLEPSEREGPISVLASSAEGHFDLALKTVHDFAAAGENRRLPRVFTLQKEHQKENRAKTAAAVMLIYSKIALHAPKQQLLARVEMDIVENILCQYRTSPQDTELKLALIQSVTEVSCALQGVGTCENFSFASKRVLLELVLDFMKQEPLDCVASPVRYRAILAVEHLSKIKPSLTQKENCHLLQECFRSLFPLPPLEQTKEGEAADDAEHAEALYARSLEALARLMTSLEEELTLSWLKETFHLLEAWLRSGKEWERERALYACTHLLKTYTERLEDARENSSEQFGSMIGVLGPLSCDSLATSRQRAVDCISCLLSTQGKVMHTREVDLNHFCEDLVAADVDSLLRTSSKIAKVACKSFCSEQARGFLKAVLGSMLSFSPTCARAAGEWMLIFLKECGREMLLEVPEILTILYDHLPAAQQGSLKEFLFEAVSVLGCYHPEAVTNSLLQRHLPMDSDTVELWRTLGRGIFAIEMLQLLMGKVESAEDTPARSNCLDEEGSDNLAALEPLMVTCAIRELVYSLEPRESVSLLLPRLFPMLLKQISNTLGKELPSSAGRVEDEPVLVASGEGSSPCRLSIKALDTVLCKCISEKWMGILRKQNTWAFLENPRTYHEGMCLLTSVLLQTDVVTLTTIRAVLPWLDSPSANLRIMAASFFAELMKAPVLQKWKLLQPVRRALVDKSLDASSTVRRMAVRGLGNLASGAPEKLRKHKKAILKALMRAIKDVTSSEIVGESLSALAKVVAELGEKDIGVTFKEIALYTKTFFDVDEAVLRSSAFTLYGVLASSAKRKWKSFLGKEITTSTWTRIMLHLQDPDPEVCNACRSTFLLCTPFLGLQKLQTQVALNTEKSAEELQEAVCSHLARDMPELLESVYDTLQTYFWSSCWGMRTAAIRLAGVILENADSQWLREHSTSFLSTALHLFHGDEHPSVQQAAAQVLRDNWVELRNLRSN
ncbi:maestro heat-like repeat-containing protein family member 2B [Dromaius novaehollandiae]|uniref:maestro heat-like repeat-containing protein family member 2B n=1 Tax=Dromaius novaehollandiae TaxID=8790 RepID=UPI0031203F72